MEIAINYLKNKPKVGRVNAGHPFYVLNFFYWIFTILIDINECEPTNDCMHKCNNTIGNYTCYCNEFFEVNQSDSKSCVRK